MSTRETVRRTLVQKYGGTSLGTVEKVRAVARRVVDEHRRGHRVVVVVSAMGHATDELLEQVRAVSPDPPRRELDVLLSTGEQVSRALLAMAIAALGEEPVSLSGAQAGIVTNDVHGNARIVEIHPERLLAELERGRIPVVAGFQGMTRGGETTTLGRGGSDTTAVALAAALGADGCEIYTDVDGVYSADPRRVAAAQLLPAVSAPEMQELAWHGAQVLKAEAVELAASNGVVLGVGRSLGEPGTWVLPPAGTGYVPRQPAVAGVAGRRDLLGVTLGAGAVAAGLHRRVLAELAGYDLVFAGRDGDGDLHLFLSDQEIPDLAGFRDRLGSRFGAALGLTTGLGAVSLVGFGIGSRPGSLLSALALLEEAATPVLHTFTGRESLSFVLEAPRVMAAVDALHRALLERRLETPRENEPAPAAAPV
jgi:aspartate kinase